MKGLGCTQSLMQVRDEATRQTCSCDSELWCNVMKHRPGPGTAATFHHESRYWAGTALKRVIVRSEPGQQRVRPRSWNCDFKTSYELNYRLQTIFIRIGWISVCLLCHDICNSVTIFTNEILIICRRLQGFIHPPHSSYIHLHLYFALQYNLYKNKRSASLSEWMICMSYVYTNTLLHNMYILYGLDYE